jgi:predicted ATPase
MKGITALMHWTRNGQNKAGNNRSWWWIRLDMESKEVNLWTGYQNEGKSLFLNQLALIKALLQDGNLQYLVKFSFR